MHIKLSYALIVVAVCVPLTANAQWAVVDVDAIAQLTKQVQQGAQQVQVAQQQYAHMQAMARRVAGLTRYRSPSNIFEAVKYADQYAQLAKWAAAENSGDTTTAEDGYNEATIYAKDGTTFLTKINSAMSSSTRAMYATQQVMDGNNMAAIAAVGRVRNAAAQYRAAIGELEKDAQTDSDDAQAQLAVEQRTSNAAIVQLRQTQDTNTLIAALLDQEIARNKLTRDQLAASANNAIDEQEARENASYLYDGISSTLANWRVR